MAFFIEALESRQFLSAVPMTLGHPPIHVQTGASSSVDLENETGTENDANEDTGGDQETNDLNDSSEHTTNGSADTENEKDESDNSTATATAVRQAGITPLATLRANLVGKWKGTVTVTGVHSQPVAVNISKQTSIGRLSGVLTTSQDSSIRVTFSGVSKANRKVSVVLKGTHPGGSIDGSGTGKVSTNGKTLSITMTFVQNGRNLPGTLILKRV